jgi:hypothetical protein
MVYMGPYARVDYLLTLCPLQSRLKHIYHGQPYDRINLNPTPPESTLSTNQGLRIWPLKLLCKNARKERVERERENEGEP